MNDRNGSKVRIQSDTRPRMNQTARSGHFRLFVLMGRPTENRGSPAVDARLPYIPGLGLAATASKGREFNDLLLDLIKVCGIPDA